MSEIAPSILAADFNHLGESISELEKAGIKVLHIDVMDGRFVPSISFGMPVIESIRRESSLLFDVHLMIEEPVRYIEEFVRVGADSITVHSEACKDVKAVIEKIHAHNVKAGIAFNPATGVEGMEDVLGMADLALVMSVNPGFGGQKFMPEVMFKVDRLKQFREKLGYSYNIEIDGGINSRNIEEVSARGVDWIVAGTAVFRGNIEENVIKLKEVLGNASRES